MFNLMRNVIQKQLVRSYHRVNKKPVWKERLSLVYAFISLNCFIVVVYSVVKGKADWVDYYGLQTEEEKQVPAALQWAPILGTKNAKVFKFSGFTKVGEYEIDEHGQMKKEDKETIEE